MLRIPEIELLDGNKVPQLGFGIWGVDPKGTAQAVQTALELGYRLIDGAYLYNNEEGMGEGFRRSGLAREDVFLTTKVWNHEHGRDKARTSVQRSLEAVGVDQFDLILIHWPVPEQDLYVETWQAFIEMRDEGLMRSIGVSNFNQDHLARIIKETGETPVLNQIEINPELQQPQLLKTCQSLHILAQAWTPLGNGRSFETDAIIKAANQYEKSPAQIILRWHIQMGHALLSRSSNNERQAQNLDIFDFELAQADMDAIQQLDMGLRTGPDPSVFKMMM